jgi:hypothetical protein
MPRHPIDLLSLLVGLGVCALGAAGLGTWVDIRHVDSDWVAPTVLVLLGLALFGSIVSRSLAGPADVARNLPDEPGVGDTSGSRDP